MLINKDEVNKFKKELRDDLLQKRMKISDAKYTYLNKAISQLLVDNFTVLQWMNLGFYWPYMGEFDPLSMINNLRMSGARVSLPVITEKKQPLKFFEWLPTVRMTNGIFNIPIPIGTSELKPNVLFIPLIGFDNQGYRLGYGGGYYDRTLASMNPTPLTIGVGFENGRITSICPQPYDIPMDFIVTENGIYYRNNNKLEQIIEVGKVSELISTIINIRSKGIDKSEGNVSFVSPVCYFEKGTNY